MRRRSDRLSPERSRPGSAITGVGAGLVSAASFGLSGSFAQSLFASGWSPAAVVAARLSVAGLVLLPFALVALRGRWAGLARQWPIMCGYGVIAVAGCQLFFFSAVQRLSIGVALMLEFTSPLLLVLGFWLFAKRIPKRLTIVGCVLAMLGLMLVLDVASASRIDLIGVLFGMLAAGCNAVYWLISGRTKDGLPPLVLATGGLLIGAVVMGLSGLVGLVPMRANTAPVQLASLTVAWFVPVLAVAVISASLPYVAGIIATRRLGATVAAFIGLSEVLFAVLWGWLLVHQVPSAIQLIGGVVVLIGVIAIKLDDARRVQSDSVSSGYDEAVPRVTSALPAEPLR